MLRKLTLVSFMSLALSLTSCGDGAAKLEPTPTEDTSTSVVPVGLPVFGLATQELTFEGVVEGVMLDADTSCSWFHGAATTKGRYQVLLQGFFAGARHSLRIVVNDYEGPGDYSWDGVPGSGHEVTVEIDSKEKGHATVFVADPGDNGEISATITSPNQGQITGLFQCAGIPR